MNYYQSLNTNNKIFFLKYQICKLEKIYDNLYITYYYEQDNYNFTEDYGKRLCKKMDKVEKLLNRKKLKFRLIKKKGK
jgi:hypothetical protein